MAPPPAPWRNGRCAQVWLPVRLGIERLSFAQKNTHELSRLCVAGGDLSVGFGRGDAEKRRLNREEKRLENSRPARACRLRATLKLIVMA